MNSGARVREARLNVGLDLGEVASAVQRSAAWLSLCERGLLSFPEHKQAVVLEAIRRLAAYQMQTRDSVKALMRTPRQICEDLILER